MTDGPKRVAILISGGGSNMVSLVQSMSGDHPARAVLALSMILGRLEILVFLALILGRAQRN